MRNVNIAGVGMTRFGRHLDRSLKDLAAEAIDGALRDAGAGVDDIEMAFFSNSVAGLTSGQESIRGQVAMPALQGKPIVNVENACASGSTAVHLARLAVGSGQVEAAIAVGAEKLFHTDKTRTFAAMSSAVDVDRVDEIKARIGADQPGAEQRSMFMDVYAEMTRRFMERTGATEHDFAQIAVKSHDHAALNPRAQYRTPVTVDEVLASRMIAPPLTLLMCSPIGDGAAAVLVCSDELAGRLGSSTVRIRASVLVSGRNGTYGETVPSTVRSAYEEAGVGPDDLDVVECHDATAPAEMMLYEDLGLAEPGEASKLLRADDTTLGGRVPVNTSGGLISKGHPVGASGCAQLVELTEQLRGHAGDRQVDGARIALAENAGGFLDPDVAACCVTILEAP
ncbi:thiolase family protein [Nitriliruptoraceae bacterium ZYF776]|nr:thiolase family protein [Profundirhabdus halotolerans]